MQSLKKNIVKKISFFCTTSYDDVIKKIKYANVKYVSFDIFDTLIKRNVESPSDIFSILEKIFNQKFNLSYNFKKRRIECEKIAHIKSSFEDVTLSEIYSYMTDLSEGLISWLIEKEIELELKFCCKNRKIFEIYNWCIKNNIKIYIVSDMYLSEETIIDILKNNAYSGWEKIYFSSKCRLTKASGNLFRLIIDKEFIKPNELMHIGDAFLGDYIMPKTLGINACLIPQKVILNDMLKSQNHDSLDFKVLSSYINNSTLNDMDFFSSIGYSVLGPILFGYVKWLYNRLKSEDINKIFFLAREGKLLKAAFDVMYDNSDIDSFLICVSRKATIFPSLETINNFDDLLDLYLIRGFDFPINHIYDLCCLSDGEISDITKKIRLSKDILFSNLKEKEKQLLFNTIKPTIIQKINEQRNNIKGYLNNFPFKGKVAVADVGWNGTIQKALQRIFPNNNILGFYIGKKSIKSDNNDNIEAFLFDNVKNQKIKNEVMFTVNLFEMLFLSTDGSTVSYGHDENGYFPIKLLPEHSEENIKLIVNMQKEAIRFVKDFNKSGISEVLDISPESFYNIYSRLVNPPQNIIVNKFKKFKFLNYDVVNLTATHNLFYYLLHPFTFKKDFFNNYCKLFFLKSIFKIKLPYFNILCFLKNFDSQ